MTATRSIDPSRIRALNAAPEGPGEYVLYWMQQSQRAERNHALEFAIQQANRSALPCLVAFALTADYPEANLRHYRFLLEGLAETGRALSRRGIRLVVRLGDPVSVVLRLAQQAALVVCDRGYLRHQRAWRARVASEAACRVVEVESDLVVPVGVASDHREYAARTFRPHLQRHLESYLVDLRATPLVRPSLGYALAGEAYADVHGLIRRLQPDATVAPTARFRGGATAARGRLRRFLSDGLPGYAAHRNQPHLDSVSYLSPYLHFGQLSSLWVALQVRDAAAPQPDKDAFLEELLVRRELAANFTHHSPDDYDRYEGLPHWARATLGQHAGDPRPSLYDRRRLSDADTHDPYWNAAMIEMRETGYLHNHLRMYWGKKVLEWQESPEAAYATLLWLNDRYFLDGRDPSSYANVGWIFGLHDRPWGWRPVFGSVRYMSAGGLERKTDMRAYLRKAGRWAADRPGPEGRPGRA